MTVVFRQCVQRHVARPAHVTGSTYTVYPVGPEKGLRAAPYAGGAMAGHWLRDTLRKRLRYQGLAGAPFTSVAEVVGWLGAVQSQEYAVAKWSVGQRATGLSDAGLDRALAEGTLIRTHVLRPTWHFVLPADVRWLLALTAPRVHAASASYHRRLGLDAAVFSRGDALLARLLAGGNQLTRKQIAAELAVAGITTDNLVVGFLLLHAELEQVVCSGALNGKQRTYALFDERVPPAPARDRDDALAELTRRYFTSHGPATRADYQWWSSLTAADASRGLELAAAHLAHTDVDGARYWYAATPPPAPVEPTPRAHLVQPYDEYLVAYRGARAGYDREGWLAAGRNPFPNGVLLDGEYVANWRRTLTSKELAIEIQPVRPLDRAAWSAVAEAVERYADFVGLPPSLTIQDGSDA